MRNQSILNITSITIGGIISFLIFILGWINVFDSTSSALVLITDNIRVSIKTRVEDIEKYFLVFNKITEIKKENEDLTQRVIELESQLIEKENQINNISFVIENGLTNFDPNRQIIAARIIFYDSDQSGRAFINKGSSDELSKGDIIVLGKFAIGEIVEVFGNYSEIKIIATSNYRVNVVTSQTGTRGILEGTLGGEIKVIDLLSDDPINVGDVFLTEGKDNKYPFGLYVGTVEKIIGTPAEPTKTVILKNSLDLKSLDRIYIMKLR